jgi:hypothetical protein
MPLERAGRAGDRAEPGIPLHLSQRLTALANCVPMRSALAARRTEVLISSLGCQNESISAPHLRSALALQSQHAAVAGSCCFNFSDLSEVNRASAASFNPASMRSHSRPYSGPVLPRDLTEPARFKNSFAPVRLLRIFILQLLRGDLCNTISYQTDATCLTRNWA